MKRRSRKKLVRLILLPIISLVILILIAIAILYSQQQRLVGLAVKELNKQLPGELVVGGSDISVFQTFPYISIGLNKVQFYASKDQRAKPLYEAERMYVGFSLPDILKQQYHVKVILLKNGHLDLVQDTAGNLNIVEASRMNPDTTTVTSAKPSNLDLDIKKIVLKNMDISFLDKENRQQVSTHIDRIQSSFRDENHLIYADLQGKMLIDYTRRGDTTLFRHKHLETDIQLSYDQAVKMLKLPVGKLKLEDAVFNITGTADLLHDNFVDLRFSGDKPDFKQMFAFAPSTVANELKHFRYDGHLSFEGSVKGNCKGRKMPLIELSFACTNAWLHNTQANKKLDSLAFKGYYTNGAGHCLQTSELRLLDMYARPEKGRFKGNFIMRDFTDPKILMQVHSDLELGFIGAFLGIKDLERVTGHISLKMNFKEMVDLEMPEKEMSELTEGIQSELTVRDLTFRIPSYPHLVEHLDLHANMKNGYVKLDSLSCHIGHSDFHLDGSLEDLPALFHNQQKPVSLTLNAHSRLVVLQELFAKDSTEKKNPEEIRDFNIGLTLQTSINELRHPQPMPKGQLNIHDLNVSFKKYPHDFRGFGGDLTINDTALMLRKLTGQIDSSDIRFSGKVVNYTLWFEKVKRGKTTLGFDFKSHELAIADVVGPDGEKYLPKDIYNEVGSNIWLRSKMELRYDSIFQFANVRIANISGAMKNLGIRVDSLHGNVKFGIDHFLKIDTLHGRIGNSDIDLNMRLYMGKDSVRRKKENFLRFSSHLLDVDQLTDYVLTAEQEEATAQAMTAAPTPLAVATSAKTASGHADAFNIFQIPFIDFNASVNIDRLRYHHLGIKNISTNMRMLANQQLYLDTLALEMAGGKINAWANFDGRDPKKIYLKSRLYVEDVNIEKLMLKMDYLGQDYVINKNIKGTLSGQIQSYVQVHPDLTPQIDQSEAQMDLEILNGVLVNFAPMQAMSAYFKDKNLSMVRFDTLQNSLSFKNGALIIPDMNINSSLGFMEISGRQSMDLQMEYYIRIPLKLVTQAGFHMLFGKKKEEVDPDQVDAIEYRDKDRRVRFMNLKISGTPSEYKVGLGKAKNKKES